MAPILLTNNIYKWYSNPAAEAYWFFELTRKYFLEKIWKTVDRWKNLWYYKRVAAENKTAADEPWKPKIEQYVKPWKFYKKGFEKGLGFEKIQNGSCKSIKQKQEANQTTVNGKRISQELVLIPGETFKHESLILAQDERWRRA